MQFHGQVVGRAACGSRAQCFSDTSEFHCGEIRLGLEKFSRLYLNLRHSEKTGKENLKH